MKATFSAMLFALAAIAAGTAHAGADAAASIGQVTLGIIDLTPGDGIAAGFTVTTFDSRLIVYTDTRNTGGTFDRNIVPLPGYAAGSADITLGTTLAGASTSGAIGDVAAQAATSSTLGLDNLVSGESEQRLWLTLRPGTLLTVAGNVLTQAHRTLGDGEGYRVFTWASVDITDSDMITTSYLSRESALIWGEQTTDALNVEDFLLSYANVGTGDLAVSMNFLAYADITVTAVPEPGAYLLLLAGLPLLWVARKAAARESMRCRCDIAA